MATTPNRAFDIGIRQLVFISTIKVNGEETTAENRFKYSDLPVPKDPYAISKWEAEQALRQIASETDMEVVIIRPPAGVWPWRKN